MGLLDEKIETFLKINDVFRIPLEKIINNMLNRCRYINGESLERHNWGNKPIKLKNLPNDFKNELFEEDLVNTLNLDENEKSIIELLWGDIQLGKRIQACIIMWISVHILKRPVLYIFRNLSIDQKQLRDDIGGTEIYHFNTQFIKKFFEESQEVLPDNNINYYKDFILPGLKDINSDDIINKLSNKDAINPNDIYCCLMNNTQLIKINDKFSEYIHYNNELVDMSILVDESDLMSPTSSNDKSNLNDIKDCTKCEILLAKIYTKVKYALHITGTAHSLLYNITTRLSDYTDIQIKVSKVHKMIRSEDYYGIFNNSINFDITHVKSWWEVKGKRYDIIEDYNINIKKIIEEIQKRPLIKYNSFLISEEKIRDKHFYLVNKILNDFSNLFIIIFHGDCLRLYLSKDYIEEIKRLSMWDANESKTGQRLYQIGGIYGSPIDTEKSEKLPNNYCYFIINSKILNIKYVYKLLRILFDESNKPIKYKTIITITGKYGERGYSFTSDDYGKYSLHLTDQYFVSHASLNCTDISQRLRLQGKYNDNELKNGGMKLTLWTTSILQKIIENFYVKFIKEIEKYIMSCESWEEIKDSIESILDKGDYKFKDYLGYIDVRKKRKNIKSVRRYDIKHNGYRLLPIEDMEDEEITKWCKEKELPEYICVNEIKEMNKDECQFNKVKESGIPIKINLSNIDILDKCKLTESNKSLFLSQIKDDIPESFEIEKKNLVNKRMIDVYNSRYEVLNIKNHINNGKRKNPDKNCKNNNDYNLLIITNDIPEYDCKKGDCFITYYTDKNIIVENNIFSNNPIDNQNIFITNNDKVIYSVLNEKYIDNKNVPDKYYWKTPDGWLYLHDNDKTDILSLKIISPLPIKNVIKTNISTELLINNDIQLFTNIFFKKSDNKKLRYGIREIYTKYEIWCKENNKEIKPLKKFQEELVKLNYNEEKSKGIDINNNRGKRGYNIMMIAN